MGNDSLSEAEIGALREIAGTMIPADAALGVPGADDPAILADIVRSVGRDLPLVREALAAIGSKSGGAFAGLGRDETGSPDQRLPRQRRRRRPCARAGDPGRLLPRRPRAAGA